MSRWLLGVLLVVAGCSGAKSRPLGPPPEYEAPVVAPWDAGVTLDPLEQAERQGEWASEPGNSASASADAGARDAGNR